jgi:tRNA threonylcarbamoyladenosine modification (KEOPS) complex  Pcc1 subunit
MDYRVLGLEILLEIRLADGATKIHQK